MKFISCFLSVFLVTGFLIGQTEKEAYQTLQKIKNIDDVQNVIKKYPKWEVDELFLLETDTAGYNKVITSKPGEIVRKDYERGESDLHSLIKVIDRNKVEVCKIQYIFISLTKHSAEEVDSIQAMIIQSFNDGIPFIELVKMYSEDRNPTGDLPWFREGSMVDEFDMAVRPMKKGNIIEVDIPSKKWAYVVLKLEDNKLVEELSVVRIMF